MYASSIDTDLQGLKSIARAIRIDQTFFPRVKGSMERELHGGELKNWGVIRVITRMRAQFRARV